MDRVPPNQRESVTVYGERADIHSEVREHGNGPLGGPGDRNVVRDEAARKASPSLVGKRWRGFFCRPVLAVVVLFLGLPLVTGAWFSGLGLSSPEPEPMTCQATRGMFLHEVSVRGEVQSAINVEVRCDVRSPNYWMTILEVVPEGTRVEPGDFLVRLDSSALEAQLDQQKIRCEQSKATVAAAREACKMAEKEERVYLEGEYRLARQQIERAILLAENKAQQADQYYQESCKLRTKGYVSGPQLHADHFGLRVAESDLAAARVRLRMLDNYIKPVRLARIQSALACAKARLLALEYSDKLNQQLLVEVQEQIDNCVVRAPVAGSVVLAHLFHNGHSHMIEPGEQTYRNRVLVRLPDARHMQVAAMVEEDKIAFVRQGLPVSISLEAFPGVTLPGRVVRVNEYPEAEGWLASGVKKYMAVVRIDKPLEGIRPLLTADLPSASSSWTRNSNYPAKLCSNTVRRPIASARTGITGKPARC